MTNTTGNLKISRPGCLAIFGLFWVAFSGIFVIVGISQRQTVFTIISLIFVLVGLGLLTYALFSYYTRFRIGQPEVTISEQMLRVGEKFSVSFFQKFNRSVQLENIRLELVFRETATYQRGTDTTTVTHNHVVAQFEEPGGHFPAGHLLQKNYELEIPRTGMHTLKVRRNRLEWFVRLVMKVPKLPDLVEEYELEVIPVLMR